MLGIREPQDGMPQVGYERGTQFVAFVNEMGIDQSNETAMEYASRAFFGQDPWAIEAARDQLSRHTASPVNNDNLIFRDGPFTWRADELILDVTYGGSELMKWIPTGPMKAREESSAHLSWVLPQGFQPAQETYGDYLAQLEDEGDCGCGPTTDWGAFEYVQHYGDLCVETDTMKMEDWGLRNHEKTPIPRVRGPQTGFSLESDADWAVARTAIHLEQHLEWNLIYGVEGGTAQWDGLMQVLTPGYVAAHVVGAGAPYWANPLVVDGSAIAQDDCDSLLRIIRAMVRMIRTRIMQRNWRVGFTDMAIVLPRPFWAHMLDCMACGAASSCGTDTITKTQKEWREERERFASGGLGWGVIEVDGVFVPVLPANGMSTPGVDGSGNNISTGNILILTRRANGMNILEQQFLNFETTLRGWQQAVYNSYTVNGGYTKVGWIVENERCFKYYAEMAGRLAMHMAPLQGVLTSVTIETDLDIEHESGFLDSGFYAAIDGSTLIPS